MRSYFEQARSADAAWAVFFLTGRKPKQLVQAPKLAAWASEAAGVPYWMFEESYDAVGDLAGDDRRLLLLPYGHSTTTRSLASSWVEETLLPLRAASDDVQRQVMIEIVATNERRPAIYLEQIDNWSVARWSFAATRYSRGFRYIAASMPQ